ncbi:MAG TPA: hypothetical protein VGG09_12275 [Acidimicrobiales bacterium]
MRFEISGTPFIVTGATDEDMDARADTARQQIAFYASTRAYRAVLELHGWGPPGDELTALSKRREWEGMGRQIGDTVLGAFAIVAEPADEPKLVLERYGEVVTLITPYPLGAPDAELWGTFVERLHLPRHSSTADGDGLGSTYRGSSGATDEKFGPAPPGG